MWKSHRKGLSSKQVAKEESIESGTIRRWGREYLEEGEKALENKRKPSYGYRGINIILLREIGW